MAQKKKISRKKNNDEVNKTEKKPRVVKKKKKEESTEKIEVPDVVLTKEKYKLLNKLSEEKISEIFVTHLNCFSGNITIKSFEKVMDLIDKINSF